MPHPTPVRTSGILLGSRLPTLHFPSHASQVSRVHNAGLKRNAVGGVLLNAPSPLWGSPIFPFCSRFFLRAIMIPMFLPSCMPLSLLLPAASSNLGQRQHRQGGDRLLRHR